ncbi:hypothetical protein QC762_0023350 [Podospora pseudocomata]|uniref:Uncharacterized protein n=1 Tax=Podospora pseudocomata TaxID=2093779 RepID=A0ABR0GYI5_9PEZI|nr:hypothetical protein QC762_0023350 [Podospora pseudocomata]
MSFPGPSCGSKPGQALKWTGFKKPPSLETEWRCFPVTNRGRTGTAAASPSPSTLPIFFRLVAQQDRHCIVASCLERSQGQKTGFMASRQGAEECRRD